MINLEKLDKQACKKEFGLPSTLIRACLQCLLTSIICHLAFNFSKSQPFTEQKQKLLNKALQAFLYDLYLSILCIQKILSSYMQAEYSQLITTKLPLDSQGYTLSFNAHDFDPKTVKEFFNKFGFVIFNNVLTKQQVELSIDDLWRDVNDISKETVKKDDPNTWNFRGGLKGYGFVGSKPTNQPQFWKNRTNPLIYSLFKQLYELSSQQTMDEPMLCLFDRASMLRPTKTYPTWRTSNIYHFDIDPWAWTNQIPDEHWRRDNRYDQSFNRWMGEGCYVPKVGNYTKLQGVLAFSSTGPTTGGFECVCGFQNYISEWCTKNKVGTYIEDSKELMDNMQKCYQREGSLLIFSRELPHNIFPNDSEHFRYAQYLRMAPQSTLMLTPQEKQARRKEVRKMLPPYLDTNNPIYREIYMLNANQLQSKVQS